VLAAVLINTLLMTMVFQLFHWTHRKMLVESAGYLALAGYWLSFEYLHLRWDLNWPWLNLGHGFAAYRSGYSGMNTPAFSGDPLGADG
jgi:apolipoprotein N-acyltransferase